MLCLFQWSLDVYFFYLLILLFVQSLYRNYICNFFVEKLLLTHTELMLFGCVHCAYLSVTKETSNQRIIIFAYIKPIWQGFIFICSENVFFLNFFKFNRVVFLLYLNLFIVSVSLMTFWH